MLKPESSSKVFRRWAVISRKGISLVNRSLLSMKISKTDHGIPDVEVNGRAAHPVFRYLIDPLPAVLGGRIKWNFTRF